MLTAKDILNHSKVIPVVAIEDADKAVDIAQALLEGGIAIIEVTLRTDEALQAMQNIAQHVPQMLVGAGTVLSTEQFNAVEGVGAKFVISPGATPSLYQYAGTKSTPLLAGVSSASDIMQGMEYGHSEFKLFPANVVGGVGALKAFSGPFKDISFCPTGGVSLQNMNDFLTLDNVTCVGGSWLTSKKLINDNNYEQITILAQEAIRHVNI